MKNTFTRKEVIAIIHEILQYPDKVIDAVQNEDTEIGALELFKLAETVLINNSGESKN